MKEYRENGGSCNYCYYHPKQLLIGVCPLCLNDKLLVLAAKQGLNVNLSNSSRNSNSNSVGSSSIRCSSQKNKNKKKSNPYATGSCKKKASPISLPKLFALGSIFYPRYTRRHLRRSRPDSDDLNDNDNDDTASTSLEEDESFISIKFGDNGVASWDKSGNTVSKVSLQHCSSMSMSMPWGSQSSVKNKVISSSNNSTSSKSVVEHAKPRAPSLRWRKRIGQLLQVIRWNKSSSKAPSIGGNGKVETVKMRTDTSWMRTLKIRTKKEQ